MLYSRIYLELYKRFTRKKEVPNALILYQPHNTLIIFIESQTNRSDTLILRKPFQKASIGKD